MTFYATEKVGNQFFEKQSISFRHSSDLWQHKYYNFSVLFDYSSVESHFPFTRERKRGKEMLFTGREVRREKLSPRCWSYGLRPHVLALIGKKVVQVVSWKNRQKSTSCWRRLPPIMLPRMLVWESFSLTNNSNQKKNDIRTLVYHFPSHSRLVS